LKERSSSQKSMFKVQEVSCHGKTLSNQIGLSSLNGKAFKGLLLVEAPPKVQ